MTSFEEYLSQLPLGRHYLLVEQPAGLSYPVVSEGGCTVWFGDKRLTVVPLAAQTAPAPFGTTAAAQSLKKARGLKWTRFSTSSPKP